MITTYINYELRDFSETVEKSSLIWESNRYERKGEGEKRDVEA
jgi:hypothetical protein